MKYSFGRSSVSLSRSLNVTRSCQTTRSSQNEAVAIRSEDVLVLISVSNVLTTSVKLPPSPTSGLGAVIELSLAKNEKEKPKFNEYQGMRG